MKIIYKKSDPFYFEVPQESGELAAGLIWVMTMLLCGFSVYLLPSLYTLFIFIFFFICILVAMFIGFFETGNEVNLELNVFRKYHGREIIRYGTWKKIPEYDFLLIRKNAHQYTKSYSGSPLFELFNTPGFYYDLILVTKGEYDVLIFASPKHDYIIAIAWELSVKYKIKIFERTVNGDNEVLQKTHSSGVI